MGSPKPEIDLEKELTCSICTELLYQPLTLLDCLHTFCGACLKEWFSWRAAAAASAPTPPASDSAVFTCPSCRAPVRDTRHNATVATLLDMFLAANPDKARTSEEKKELNQKYKPGDAVLPRLVLDAKSPEQRWLEEQDGRLLEEVRGMSLREAVGDRSSRRRDGSLATHDARGRHGRHTSREPGSESRAGHGRYSSGSRHRTTGHRTTGTSEPSSRHIEHQSSLRSLISSSDPGFTDIEREIEEFARQIQEEGLLDGLDLDNLDLDNNDDLSRKITEAYRRRQRQRPRQRPEGGRSPGGDSRLSDRDDHPRPLTAQRSPSTHSGPSSRGSQSRSSSRPSSTRRAHSRSLSANRPADDRSRPPPSFSATHLDVQESERRHRRRTSSGSRSLTTPVLHAQQDTRPAARSQADLPLRAGDTDALPSRPAVSGEVRSSSSPTAALGSPSSRSLPFNARVTNSGLGLMQPLGVTAPEHSSDRADRGRRPAGSATRPAGADLALPERRRGNSTISPASSPSGRPRSSSQLYSEPLINCHTCGKEHIEYQLHYNCSICQGGDWNVCLDCYRRGKGCLHWFGFGYAARQKWEKAVKGAERDVPEPHVLTASRYSPPKTIPGGADGRQTLTTQNPAGRLQSGAFCSQCLAWTNECFWECITCNDGEWGYCTDCVNQGLCCTHPLLSVAYQPKQAVPGSPNPSTAWPAAGPAARPETRAAHFQPLQPVTRCDACQLAIPPAHRRLHCYTCTSTLGAEPPRAGSYNECQPCYADKVRAGAISAENGPDGWRRCRRGHRMEVVAFLEAAQGGSRGGGGGGAAAAEWWRVVVRERVGGRKLQVEDRPAPAPQTWFWTEARRRRERAATQLVRDTAAAAEPCFPPDGGCGARAVAMWGWFPAAEGAEDELMFPRGAEIREVVDVNGEWLHGVYMGVAGLFPAPYVRVLDG